MHSSGTMSPAADFAAHVSWRISEGNRVLAMRWLDRLRERLPVADEEIFPSPSLLDHIPELIARIGVYVGAPEAQDIGANSAVVLKAQELGRLRHAQRASVHQILHEYDLLVAILTAFVKEEMARLDCAPPAAACIDVIDLIRKAVSLLRRATIDTFLGRYVETVTAQAKQIEGFNRMLSHELRQPLATVLGTVRLLQAQKPAPSRAQLDHSLDVLARNVERVTTITRQLERIARVGVERDGPTTQDINVSAMAAEAARQLREMAASRGVTIEVAPDLPSITTDAARLELVFVNLLSNAIKYSDPAKPQRLVAVRRAPADDGWCAFTVRDNGLGMPPDRVQRIFDPFVRAHPQRDAELAVEGMGLGLSIVKECVDAMGGSISVESAEGSSTTFTVTLPLTCGAFGEF